MRRILTYDFGTTSLKAAVVDHEATILSEANESYPLSQPQPGWAEQDPVRMWAAGARAGALALERAGLDAASIDAIVFVAPWKAAILVAEDGAVLHPAIIWMDGRADAQASHINGWLDHAATTGQDIWPRLMWLKQERTALWERARWVMGMNTFLKWKATGVVANEPSDDFVFASRVDGSARYGDMITAAGLDGDLSRFAPVQSATEIVGLLTDDAARQLGLAPGTPVLGGFGDLPALTIGAGALTPGSSHIYIGTSSWFVVLAPAEQPVESPLTYVIDKDYLGALYPLLNGGIAREWIVAQTYGEEAKILGADVHDLVAVEVAAVPPGADNLIATHWLNGELPPLSGNARGVFLNLTTTHTRAHMVRAVMEGLCYSHRRSIEQFEASSATRVDKVTVVGGGAESAVWMQILADVLQRTVHVPVMPRYTGTIGAQHCAIVGLGDASDLASVSRRRPDLAIYEPSLPPRETYDRLYRIYLRLYPALAPIFDELNGPRGGLA
jgi:xylulokinase